MRQFIVALLCLAALSATAQEAGEVYDHQTMLRDLQAAGIEPTQVGWGQVNPLCVAFMNYKDDPTDYEHCLFEKATLSVAFASDQESCDIQSLAVTPDSIRKQPRAIIAGYNSDGTGTLTTLTTPPVSRGELRNARAATYNSCMIGLGWRNPRNWRLGYAAQPVVPSK